MCNLLNTIYKLFLKVANLAQILLLLIVRINWGWLFFVTGKGKLINHNNVVSFFSSLNLPNPETTAWFVGGVECLGGLLLLIGLATRPVGLILSINMLVAYLSVTEDRQKLLNIFNDQDAFLHADPFFFLLASLLSFCFGGGPISVDALINKLISKKRIG